MSELASSLRSIIAEQLDVSVESVTDTAELKEHLKLDKAGISSLTAALLERFDINITDEDTDRFLTTQDVFLYVENKLWWYCI